MLQKTPLVVAAAIVDSLDHPTSLLCAQRAYPEDLRGKFEFPGGKVELGEVPQKALVREIREELKVGVHLGNEVRNTTGLWPLSNGLSMRVWLAESTGIPQVTASHLRLVSAGIGEVFDLPWLPSNAPIVAAVVRALGWSDPTKCGIVEPRE